MFHVENDTFDFVELTTSASESGILPHISPIAKIDRRPE